MVVIVVMVVGVDINCEEEAGIIDKDDVVLVSVAVATGCEVVTQ